MKLLNILPYFFLAAGVALLGAGGVEAVHTERFQAQALHAEGRVVENVATANGGAPHYSPKVRFATADGRPVEFVSSAAANPAGYRPGQRVNVLYVPEAAENAELGGFWEQWLATVTLAAVGLAFALPGSLWIWLRLRARRAAAWVAAHGVRIRAEITGAAQRLEVRSNGVSPWRVTARWRNPATGRIHFFESPDLWLDPAPFARGSVEVLLDPARPERYLVDAATLAAPED